MTFSKILKRGAREAKTKKDEGWRQMAIEQLAQANRVAVRCSADSVHADAPKLVRVLQGLRNTLQNNIVSAKADEEGVYPLCQPVLVADERLRIAIAAQPKHRIFKSGAAGDAAAGSLLACVTDCGAAAVVVTAAMSTAYPAAAAAVAAAAAAASRSQQLAAEQKRQRKEARAAAAGAAEPVAAAAGGAAVTVAVVEMAAVAAVAPATLSAEQPASEPSISGAKAKLGLLLCHPAAIPAACQSNENIMTIMAPLDHLPPSLPSCAVAASGGAMLNHPATAAASEAGAAGAAAATEAADQTSEPRLRLLKELQPLPLPQRVPRQPDPENGGDRQLSGGAGSGSVAARRAAFEKLELAAPEPPRDGGRAATCLIYKTENAVDSAVGRQLKLGVEAAADKDSGYSSSRGTSVLSRIAAAAAANLVEDIKLRDSLSRAGSDSAAGVVPPRRATASNASGRYSSSSSSCGSGSGARLSGRLSRDSIGCRAAGTSSKKVSRAEALALAGSISPRPRRRASRSRSPVRQNVSGAAAAAALVEPEATAGPPRQLNVADDCQLLLPAAAAPATAAAAVEATGGASAAAAAGGSMLQVAHVQEQEGHRVADEPDEVTPLLPGSAEATAAAAPAGAVAGGAAATAAGTRQPGGIVAVAALVSLAASAASPLAVLPQAASGDSGLRARGGGAVLTRRTDAATTLTVRSEDQSGAAVPTEQELFSNAGAWAALGGYPSAVTTVPFIRRRPTVTTASRSSTSDRCGKDVDSSGSGASNVCGNGGDGGGMAALLRAAASAANCRRSAAAQVMGMLLRPFKFGRNKAEEPAAAAA